MSSKSSLSLKSTLLVITAAFFFASCGSVRYTYYKKHNVPYSAPEEIKLAKAIPNKPLLTETETALKENPAQVKKEITDAPLAKNSVNKNIVSQPEKSKAIGDLDFNKFFREHKYMLKARDGGMLDDRTTIIVLLVILILVLLALVGDGLLWLLWLALVVLLILALIKYLGLFG